VESLLERELEVLSEDDEYIKAIETIKEMQMPVYKRLEKSVQEQLKKLLPSVKKVRISRSQDDMYGENFRTPQIIIDDGTPTRLEEKGDGIKSLAAISLMRASKVGSKSESLVVAIEEPESHLHPGAVRQLATVLQEMATEHQVIITTHSPLLVARNRPEANILVSKSKAVPANSIKVVRDALGVQVEDNLMSAEYVMLVEGKTDIKVLSSLFITRSPQFKSLTNSGKVVFDDLGGTGNVSYKISSLSQAITTQILIVDDDKSGRDAYKQAEQAGLAEKYRFIWKRPSSTFRGTELEDLINVDLYWDKLESEFGVTLDKIQFSKSPESWSTRMKSAYEAGGKRWGSSVENNMKNFISDLVFELPSDAIALEHLPLIDNVISSIVRLIAN
jgi:putative ATP-dependent endonuclease of OLD family